MDPILERIKSPKDVQKLNISELLQLTREIREFLIQTVAKTGGHLASNLGVVELTLALFKILDLPKDSIIWDVGHQTYVHKLLTGRREQLYTLRQFGGLSGFPKSSESVYDTYNTGHSSTSVSAALGMTRASELLGEDRRAVAVIGDGALTGGMAFEALNDAGTYGKNFIVILNDNEMSIAKNVGGLSRYLTNLRTRPGYFRLKSGLESGFGRIPYVGKPMIRILKAIKDSFRHLLSPSTVFEDLGFTYLGPIDGHDLPFLCHILERAKAINGPVLIHVKTKKGKGYKFAEDKPTAFHGIGAFEVETGKSGKSGESYSAVFGNCLTDLAKENEKICAVVAAMPDGTGLSGFAGAFPNRFFDVGIAEQHAVTFAAGLAKRGLKPVVALYSSFMQRAYDQVLHDVCLQNLSVVFCLDRAGLVGEDGETHQGIYDLAFLSHMPNMTVLSPANFTELSQMLSYATKEHQGPIAIRYPRGGARFDYTGMPFALGKPDILCRGENVCIFAAGPMLKTAMAVKELLEKENLTVTVVNLRTLSPLDSSEIFPFVSGHKLCVTIEDGILQGGIGEHLVSLCRQTGTPFLIKAHANGIVPQGKVEELYKLCGLDAETIVRHILQRFTKEN
ncbi:MAG: 1-deoxy-D-xylulose-5-phosphate synthase [Clostridia bacterium]|nr:1-deoxy-D-xylulose-5-phosphate synthase [Clostridia bacterium]